MYMNEKVAKKVGEAYAFAQVLSDTFNSNHSVMEALFGEHAGNMMEITQTQCEELEGIAAEMNMDEVVLPKAERTGTKISKMADMYVGDEWDNPVEVLEWMSFLVGGAIVHWQLIAGSAEAMDHEHMGNVAGVGTEYYAALMGRLRDYAIEIGQERAKSE